MARLFTVVTVRPTRAATAVDVLLTDAFGGVVTCDRAKMYWRVGRALRHAVIWRKLSFGTQSEQGSRFVETMLTVIETCRQQHRNTFEYLTTAVHAHLAGQPASSLLPRA